MPSEWAMAKAQAVEGTFNCTSSRKPLILAIATEIDAARAQGRREGLEEAIVAVEKYERPLSPSHWVFGSSQYGKGYTCGRTTGKTVAIDAIRARMQEPAAQEPTA